MATLDDQTLRHPMARVLVVEDTTEIRELICDVLEERGYAVRGARDGADAVSQLSRWGACTIVTDLHMPDRDGWSLLHHVQSDPDRYRVVVLSAADDLRRAAAHPAVTAVLPKPVELNALYEAVDAAVDDNEESWVK